MALLALSVSPVSFERPLRLQPLELHARVIGELHRGGDGAVAGALGDEAVHLLADAAVGRMALRRGAQLDTCIASRAFMSM